MTRVRLCLLGGFEVYVGLGPPRRLASRKATALLAYLASPAGRAHLRDKLAALLWGDAGEREARASLRRALADIRAALRGAPSLLVLEGQTVRLRRDRVSVDVPEFERRAVSRTPAALAAAATLYRGDFLEGLTPDAPAFDEWLSTERERLRERAAAALERLLAHRTRHNDIDEAIQIALRLLAVDPLREAAHRTLMRLFISQGRRAAALRQYQICARALARELEAEPEAETRRLYRELLREPVPEDEAARQPDKRPARPWLPLAETALVGRDAELARLREALDDAVRGRPRVVAILGEAGIGKTRLATALADLALRQGARLLVARAAASRRTLPLGPWAEALRDGGVMRDAATLGGLGRIWRAELERLLPELSTGPPKTRDDGAEPARLLEAILALLNRLAEREPLVVVLEDVHDADEPSLQLLALLAGRLRTARLLIVATARDDEGPDESPFARLIGELEREPAFLRVSLTALSRSATTDLVRTLSPAPLGPQAVERLAERAWTVGEGNPFVVEEVVRSLGLNTEAVDRVPVPERVRALVARRLQRLGPSARALLPVAAVIGRAFEFGLLQRAAGGGEREAAAGVEELVRRRILHGLGDRFDFVHHRLREVAYAGLLAPTRRLLHRQVAEALEARYAADLEPHDADLAEHWESAEVWLAAARALARVAATSAHRYADKEAVSTLRRAEALLDRLPPGPEVDGELARLLLREGQSLIVLARYAEVLERLPPHESRIERLGDPRLTSQYHLLVARAHMLAAEREEGTRQLEHALAIATEAGDIAAMGQAHRELARVHSWTGRPRQGLEHSEQAITLLERAGDRGWLGQAYRICGLNYGALGDFAKAAEALDRARAIADELDDRRLRCSADFTAAWILCVAGDGAAAIAAGRRAFEEAPDADSARQAAGFLGYAYQTAAEPRQAAVFLEDAVRQCRELGYRPGLAFYTTILADARRALGELGRARALIDDGLSQVRALNYPYAIAQALRIRGRIALSEGRDAEARADFATALEIFAEIGTAWEVERTREEATRLGLAAPG